MIHALVSIVLFVGVAVPVTGAMVLLHVPLWLMLIVGIALGFIVGRGTWVIAEAIDARRKR